MKIYQNLWAGYECYFVKIKNKGSKTECLVVHNGYKNWRIEFGDFYSCSLRDEEHYPAVGEINLKKIIIESILSAAKNE